MRGTGGRASELGRELGIQIESIEHLQNPVSSVTAASLPDKQPPLQPLCLPAAFCVAGDKEMESKLPL